MTKIVIDRDCLPTRSPLTFLIMVALFLDRFKEVPGWVWGVYGTLAAILYAGFLVSLHQEKERKIPGFGERT